jgi:hypothetical protein
MKRCPQCNLDYFDEMLEYCLEDGIKLISVSNPLGNRASSTTAPAATELNKQKPTTDATVNLPISDVPLTLEVNTQNKTLESSSSTNALKANTISEKAVVQGNKVLEMAPVVISLAHNWWQWVYLSNQYYTSFSSYVFSGNFLMWLLLFVASAASGLLALKFCRNKGFAYTGLVILAINLLLFLVPKR